LHFDLAQERVKEAISRFIKASFHQRQSTTTMNGASPVTQNITPPHSQSARDFCKPSNGLFYVGFVLHLVPQTVSYSFFKFNLFIPQTLFATALAFADGMLTPAVSVTSAVAGIGLSVPSLNHNISSISIGVIVALFLAQRFGTAKLSFIFSPGRSPGPIEELLITPVALVVAFLWFSLIGACGIYNIASHPAIFRAFDPSRAILCESPAFDLYPWLSVCYRVRSNKKIRFAGWGAPCVDWLRSSLRQVRQCSTLLVLLLIDICFLALDSSIASRFRCLMLSPLEYRQLTLLQLSFVCFVYPCLILAYLGQGARLIVAGDEVIANIFYLTIPGGTNGPLYW